MVFLYYAPVVQRIEQRPSKAWIQVRFLAGVLGSNSGCSVTVARDVWDVLVRVRISASRLK